MINSANNTKYDLENRTKAFAVKVQSFVKKISVRIVNIDDIKQLLRSSGSVGANYIEANESLGKKDFLMRIRICRKEAKESAYWLEILKDNIDQNLEDDRIILYEEAKQLVKIFHSILLNSQTKSD